MRKKEHEYERLKQTLQQYIAEKKVASRRATELLNSASSSVSGSKMPRSTVPATPLRNKQTVWLVDVSEVVPIHAANTFAG